MSGPAGRDPCGPEAPQPSARPGRKSQDTLHLDPPPSQKDDAASIVSLPLCGRGMQGEGGGSQQWRRCRRLARPWHPRPRLSSHRAVQSDAGARPLPSSPTLLPRRGRRVLPSPPPALREGDQGGGRTRGEPHGDAAARPARQDLCGQLPKGLGPKAVGWGMVFGAPTTPTLLPRRGRRVLPSPPPALREGDRGEGRNAIGSGAAEQPIGPRSLVGGETTDVRLRGLPTRARLLHGAAADRPRQAPGQEEA
mgnify:CR=1 FL=1